MRSKHQGEDKKRDEVTIPCEIVDGDGSSDEHIEVSIRKSAVDTSMTATVDVESSFLDEDEEVESDKIVTNASPSQNELDDRGQGNQLNEEEQAQGWSCGYLTSLVFPQFERLPWSTFFVLTFFIAIPSAGYIALFTKLGLGLETLAFISEYSTEVHQVRDNIIGAIVIASLLLYLSDSHTWISTLGIIFRNYIYLMISLAIIVLVISVTDDHPYAPICLFTIITPIFMIFTKKCLLPYRKVETKVYVRWLSGPFLCVSVVACLMWIAWSLSSEENELNEVSKLRDAQLSGCKADFTDFPGCQGIDDGEETCFSVKGNIIKFGKDCDESCVQVYDGCLNSYVVWIGPFLVGMSLFFLSFYSTFLRAGTTEKDFVSFGKLWAFLVFALWCGSALAGAGSGIVFVIMALTLASFVSSAGLMFIALSSAEQKEKEELIAQRLEEKYGAWFDIAKGLFIVTCLPWILLYFTLSITNQFVRKLQKRICNVPIPGDHLGWLTQLGSDQYDIFKTWDRTLIFRYAIYWGILFLSMIVLVGQFTTVFMSWLIQITQSLPLFAVTAIVALAGFLMFLIPVIPGVPVYLTLGIVLVGSGSEKLGYALAISYCCVVGFLLKLFSSAFQQKGIGQFCSGYVSIRQAVSMNSHFTKSMRLILSQPGLSIPKAAILVGGPDWPTSVLCGILRLKLLPIMVGTLPIIFLIIPTVLSGALMYMGAEVNADGSPKFVWATTVGAVCTTFTAVVQFGSMMVAAYYLEQVSTTRIDEINAILPDEEVDAADEREKHSNDVYSKVTQWRVVPFWAKVILLLSLITMVISCYTVQLFSNLCFVDYGLTSSIEKDLDGDVTNLALPLGRLACLLFLVSCSLLLVFSTWAKRAHEGELNKELLKNNQHSEALIDE